MLYRSMPWIGAMSAYLDRSSASKKFLVDSLCVCLLAFYFMFLSCYYTWTAMVFPLMFSEGINDCYFLYCNMLEFANMIFIRTRCSIKYYSKLVTLLNLWFLVYIQLYFYGAVWEAFAFLNFATASLTCYVILNFEVLPL